MRNLSTLFVCGLLLLLTGCGNQSDTTQTPHPESTGTKEVSAERINLLGELTYRQRIALLPDASASVALVDLGPNGKNSKEKVIAAAHLSDFQQVPIAFSLTYPSDAIDTTHRYELRATIENAQGRKLWRSPEPTYVKPLDDSQKLSIVMQQVDAGAKHLTYQCQGRKFNVTITPDTATLQSDSRIVELSSVRSASGAKYSNGDTVFWSKGQQQAFIVIDGKTYKDCKARGDVRRH